MFSYPADGSPSHRRKREAGQDNSHQQVGTDHLDYINVGPFSQVSKLVLGGGGIGQVWGATDREEAAATIDLALSSGIKLLDMAPGYNHGQALIGDHFGGRIPAGVLITTKHWIGQTEPRNYYDELRASLETSLATMRIDRADVFFLHNEICPEGYQYPVSSGPASDYATPWRDYVNCVLPAMQRFKEEGLVSEWGITGTGHPDAILAALRHDLKPAVVQINTNLLDSPGDLARFDGPPRPRELISAASENGVGVFGIRVLQAGALTQGFDRPVKRNSVNFKDFIRAEPFRKLCAYWHEDPADTALRYVLNMTGVDVVVLGPKNRYELNQTLTAFQRGPLEAERMSEIDRVIWYQSSR